jgi:hypothetical protein
VSDDPELVQFEARLRRTRAPWWFVWLALGFMLGAGAGVLAGASSQTCPPVNVTWPSDLRHDRPIPLRVAPDLTL